MPRGWLLGVAGAAVLALTVTGCSGGGTGGESGGKTRLTYAVWDQNQVPAMKKIAAEFTKKHPDVTVTVQQTPWNQYWTKLRTAVSGGAAPDVFWMNGPNVQLYASAGVIQPLNDKIDADGFDTSVYPKPLVDMYTHKGKLYALPKDFDTVGLWYNKKLFNAAGVKHPDASWTWDDLRAAARKLTDKRKGVWGIAARLTAQEGYYDSIAQAGGRVISPDGTKSGYADPKTIGGLRLWTDLIKQGVSPTHQQMTDTAPTDLFQSGKVAMIWDGSWNAGLYGSNAAIKDKVDVAPLPKGPARRATVIHGIGNAVSAKTKHPKEAWEFVKFAESKRAALIQAETGTTIPAYRGTQEAWVTSNPQFHLQAFIDQLKYAVPFPVSKNTAAWNTDEAEILGQIWAGEISVDAGAHRLAKAMQAELDKERKS